MTRLLLPIVLAAAAIGLFVVYTNPTYQDSKAIAAQVALYDNALSKSQELKSVRDQLISKRNTFSPDDVTKLGKVLPDNVDNIRFVIDINNIAARHNLSLKGVNIGSVSNGGTDAKTLSSGAAGDAVGSVSISFSVSASYDTMIAFLQDLERSTRIIDIQNLSFTAGDTSDYALTIKTYWLQ